MATAEDAMKVLVADDEAVIATTLRAILEQHGFRTAVAFDGSAAVRLARQFEPDMLVTDVEMPRMNGIEAALEIVQQFPKCAVVLYTAKILPDEWIAKAKARGHEFPVIQKPIAPSDLLDRIRAIVKEQRTTSYKAVILNVDDHDMQRYAVTRLLEHRGLMVVEARNGAEALEQASRHPDLILLDIKLPDISGFEVCRRLKENPDTADIPIVHLTNIFKDEAAKAKALALGADDFFTHPVQPDELLAKIRELIGEGTRPRAVTAAEPATT